MKRYLSEELLKLSNWAREPHYIHTLRRLSERLRAEWEEENTSAMTQLVKKIGELDLPKPRYELLAEFLSGGEELSYEEKEALEKKSQQILDYLSEIQTYCCLGCGKTDIDLQEDRRCSCGGSVIATDEKGAEAVNLHLETVSQKS